MHSLQSLKKRTVAEVVSIAQSMGVETISGVTKEALIYKILDKQTPISSENTSSSNRTSNTTKVSSCAAAPSQGTSYKETVARKEPSTFEMTIEVFGTLELMPEGYGFLRSSDYNYLPSPDDVYIPHTIIRQWGLKVGDTLFGKARIPKEGEKYYALTDLMLVNGCTLVQLRNRVDFRNLVPLFAEEKYNIVKSPRSYGARIIDLLAPIGKGSRSLIAASPKAGKSMLLEEIANGIAHNHPEAFLIYLTISERPEELTEIGRTVKAEVIGSTFDEDEENQIKVGQITIAKAKRLVESGHDVVVFVDSITRFARAANKTIRSSGRILSGGIDIKALDEPKRIFGAARNIEHGGSLTIIGTALVDTGSRGDEVVFEEFKGTGNQEVLLSSHLASKGIYPAINVHGTSTRRDEKLLDEATYKRTQQLRYILSERTPKEAIELLRNGMRGTTDNTTLLASMHQ